jgi:hypothetical protein
MGMGQTCIPRTGMDRKKADVKKGLDRAKSSCLTRPSMHSVDRENLTAFINPETPTADDETTQVVANGISKLKS